jgi:phospholipid N-methyltransferase
MDHDPATAQIPAAPFSYSGRELESMSVASNYHRWILEMFAPYLGRHLVEVGAGLGSFSKLLLASHDCETLSLVEPSVEMYEQLETSAKSLQTNSRIETHNSSFPDAAQQIKTNQQPDSIIYVNVLEHIADDQGELSAIHQTLANHGHVFLFVPALSWLYGAFDERVGHMRRYSKAQLEEKLKRAGFQIVVSRYFDLAGVAPWWIKYRLLKSATMGPGAVRFYDRYVVPVSRRLESVIHPPIGKNVIVVARKSDE